MIDVWYYSEIITGIVLVIGIILLAIYSISES